MTPTLAAARAELAAYLAPAVGSVVKAVYSNETDREVDAPCWVTVAADATTPDSIRMVVRIYAQMADGGAATATALLDSAHDVVESLLAAQSKWGPSAWEFGVTEAVDALIARCTMERGREDIFS